MSKNLLPKTPTIKLWLDGAKNKLNQADISSAGLDGELILSGILQKSREWLLAHSDEHITQTSLNQANQWLGRRLRREPLAYILGEKEFYGHNFIVTKDTLVPRPESEAFIDTLKTIKPKNLTDIGTGSGCLAISAKLELPGCKVIATDISKATLKIAQKNASKYRAEISFLHGSLLEPIKKFNSQVIVANLPYVPENLVTSPEIKTEPSLALFAGKDGLEVYKKFWKEAKNLAAKPDYILVESLKSQHSKMVNFGESTGYGLQKTQGLVQIFNR